MPYPSLSFASLIGQDKAKNLLTKSVTAKRVGHAYLFKGPAGVGKKRAAHAFAAYLNCITPANHDACGQCPSCRKFYSGNHPDMHIIQPEGAFIKINQVRQLRKALAFPPFEARVRLVLLTDVHTMRREAANSLLKTLEEPPADTVLILTCDEVAEVLPTILSRCQHVPFFPLSDDAVVQALLDEEVPPEKASVLAAAAEGSLGKARMLLENDLLSLRQEIVETLLRLSPNHPETPLEIFKLAETTANLKEHLRELLDLLRNWLRDIILIHSGASELVGSRDLTSHLGIAKDRWNIQELSDRLRMIDKAGRQLLHNCNRALVCEVLFFGLL